MRAVCAAGACAHHGVFCRCDGLAQRCAAFGFGIAACRGACAADGRGRRSCGLAAAAPGLRRRVGGGAVGAAQAAVGQKRFHRLRCECGKLPHGPENHRRRDDAGLRGVVPACAGTAPGAGPAAGCSAAGDGARPGGGAGGGHRVAAKNQRRGVELSRQRGGGRRRGRQPDPERRPSPARAGGFTRHDRREADGDGLSARVYRRGIRWA